MPGRPAGPAQYNPGTRAPSAPPVSRSPYVPPPPPAAPAGPPPPAPAPFVNAAGMDPRLDRLGQRVENRLDNPSASTGRAIDMAVGRIRNLGEGQKRAGVAGFARRGMMGSGGQADFESGIDEDVRQQGAGIAADISVGAERHEDDMLLGATGALGAAGAANRADRGLGLDQWRSENDARMRVWEAEQSARAQAQAAAFAQQQAILNLLNAGQAY